MEYNNEMELLEEFKNAFEAEYGVRPGISINIHRLKKQKAQAIADDLGEKLGRPTEKSDGWYNVRSSLVDFSLFYDKKPAYSVQYVMAGEPHTEEVPEAELADFQQRLKEQAGELISVLPVKD
ncbi:hypothetical protein HWB91_gp26 [Bacillus phage vB_BboS-125]|uniref:Uncharacterized protein n=1 Tax=Bacillus phage vB_BboS-125 TaxID=2419618 RepID=A0A3G3BWB5_9CAUD|nr:hypothetical protein HWB91_gp26 [Bacillus phage vB_BboS-125]AYP68396.1 hypothetical protein BboS125_00026 [Bacillus phage vB_BboS-125]